MKEAEVRRRLVAKAKEYLGCNEADGSHHQIIDIYNNHPPLARGYRVTYTDAWCATFVSAMAIQRGYTDIMPTECGCGAMVALYQKLGRWMEDDGYTPQAGDVILYDWDDSGAGDNTGNPDHVGIVIGVSGSTMTIIEGNCSNAVKTRNLQVNGKNIRGFGLPDFASKADESGSTDSGNSGSTSSGAASSGSSLNRNPQWVGEVTASVLNIRQWAGVSANKLVSYPQLSQGNLVDVCDSLKAADGGTWYYIRINGALGYKYGFCNAAYIKQAGEAAAPEAQKEFEVGDTVNFTGNTHYTSSYETATGKSAKACRGKITNKNATGAHPYHVVGSGVHGWVNACDITE